jgi:hypothetical protein
MNISPEAVFQLPPPHPLNPYLQPGMHRYMVAEQGNTKHWIQLYGPHLDKGRVYMQHVLFGDLGDVSEMFLPCWFSWSRWHEEPMAWKNPWEAGTLLHFCSLTDGAGGRPLCRALQQTTGRQMPTADC